MYHVTTFWVSYESFGKTTSCYKLSDNNAWTQYNDVIRRVIMSINYNWIERSTVMVPLLTLCFILSVIQIAFTEVNKNRSFINLKISFHFFKIYSLWFCRKWMWKKYFKVFHQCCQILFILRLNCYLHLLCPIYGYPWSVSLHHQGSTIQIYL